jgi:pilus assembly protein CpaB
MKNTKWMGTLAIAAAGALVGALCVVRWMPVRAASAAQIAVAAVDIDVGQHLAPRFIKLVDSPTGKVPAGAFSDPRKLDGRILTASVERGEPLVERELQPVR